MCGFHSPHQSLFIQKIYNWNFSNALNNTTYLLRRSNSWQEPRSSGYGSPSDCEFESLHRMLDGPFYYLFIYLELYWCLKQPEINETEARDAPL